MSNANGASINLKAVLEFGRTLDNFKGKLEECFTSMEQAINRLGNDWKDDKYNEFKSEFSQHVNKLKPLAEVLKKYKDHNEKNLIPVIQKYLNASA
jgi:hypothetical protein